jgi:hypothetical protein
MTYCFGDGFDLYASAADAVPSYWDSVSGAPTMVAPGRFGGQAIQFGSSGLFWTKASNVNDSVHHFVCAYRQTQAISGNTLGLNFQLQDGTTNQCAVVFRTDGAILLTSGSAGGTVLATYANAFTLVNQWFAFEIEVVIHNTAGSFAVRTNGATSNSFSATSLNTRGGTANNYANKLILEVQSFVGYPQIDDLLWRSDASSVAWVGDIRCFTRMPASDVSAQFARAPNPATALPTNASSSTTAKAANNGMMGVFVAPLSGTIASGTVQISIGGTGNMKAAIYDATRTTVLATSNAVVNPVAGANPITFGTPPTVTKGTTYYLAVDQDFSITYNFGNNGFIFTTTYASFPATAPVTTSGSPGTVFTLSIATTINADAVSEAPQDGASTYVYDSTVNDADFYGIASIGVTPALTVAVTTRGFVEKSDAGSRSGAMRLRSGTTTVTTGSAVLSTSWTWMWRTDTTDPNTGSAWTSAGVSAVNIGPQLTA